MSNPSCLKRLDMDSNSPKGSAQRFLLDTFKDPHRKVEGIQLAGAKLGDTFCDIVAGVLKSENSLTELDLSTNFLEDSRVELLCKGLSSPTSKLQILKLAGCNLTDESYEVVVSNLQSMVSLTELDLCDNYMSVHGVQLLHTSLSHPNCKLQTLRLVGCGLTEESGDILAFALQSVNSHLRELDLSKNNLRDCGGKLCSEAPNPHCKMVTLRLANCNLTERPCEVIASAALSWVFLTEMDLSCNYMSLSGIQLLNAVLRHLRQPIPRYHNGENGRIKPELREYACELTLDPNTACRVLPLSEGNRKVTCVIEAQPYPDHPDRFENNAQVLCRQGLSGRCYWEAEWSREAAIAVAYKSIQRKTGGKESGFGRNDKSWFLRCSSDSYSAWHNDEEIDIPAPFPQSGRVGVYLDWPAGTLSFYSVSSDTLTHLHTFHSTFTEPLYPGFGFAFFSLGSSVSF
ncbi:NACHT, LRR and PYD domains-containing protein 12-like [Engraulis encrasicolus]|uniref:NACHT, LRR and PYD domains-containing protein 12-like n=1 Tax=Engraulis encrasicolus TaxID=184585 RepID=UPI002FD29635